MNTPSTLLDKNLHNSFLLNCAIDIVEKHTDLSNLILIFPNKRPIVFFKKHLQKCISKPLFAPNFISIYDFYINQTSSVIPEDIELIHILYGIYISKTKSLESFEEFYNWGEMLLNDFDDIDKYLINAEDLFKNLSSIKDFENAFDYLDDQQKEIIARFWHITSENASERKIKKSFIDIWSVLFDIYTEFKEILRKLNYAYEGMIVRDVTEKYINQTITLNNKQHIFIGFNALNTCEKELFSALQKNKSATFYWDYDASYMKDYHEASYFIAKNLQQFPNELDAELFMQPTNTKTITITEAPNALSQVKQCNNWITKLISEQKEISNSAIILADEKLIIPLVESIPTEIPYNISLGYPIQSTLAYAFIDALLHLHSRQKNSYFYYKDVLLFCSHAFLQKDEGCKKLYKDCQSQGMLYIKSETCTNEYKIPHFFSIINSPKEYFAYLLESITTIAKQEISDIDKSVLYQFHKNLILLQEQVVKSQIQISSISFIQKVLTKSIQSNTIPILGEPLQGLQIMGILEARALDFKNLTIVSLNENILPKKTAGSSFIPYSLRTGFGMPTIKDQTAMFAYYFYRLIQRAENINLLYFAQSDDSSSAEKSRYILQILHEHGFSGSKIIQNQIKYGLKPLKKTAINALKKDDTIRYFTEVHENEDKFIAPTSLYSFVECELKFYFKHIRKIKPPTEVSELLDDRVFGNIFHKTMDYIYESHAQKLITEEGILSILNNNTYIENCILKGITDESPKNKQITSSDLEFKTLETYVKTVLNHDLERCPFTIESLEIKQSHNIQIGNYTVSIGGTIDRLDYLNNQTIIIDYKTGTKKNSIKSLEELFDSENKETNSAVFQTLLYCYIISQSKEAELIQPQLWFLRDLKPESSPLIYINQTAIVSYAEVKEEFETYLLDTLNKLYDLNRPYKCTSNKDICKYCDYKMYCKV